MIGLTKHVCTKNDWKTKYDFRNFTFPSKFTSKIIFKDFKLQEVKDDQQKWNILIIKLNKNYTPVNKVKKRKRWCFRVCKKIV